MGGDVLLEVCIDTLASGIAAEAGGAGRIELCSALSEGGLTPTVGFLRQIKAKVKIPIFVMIRPRRGDFMFGQDEIDIMKEDVRVLKENGADGFVFGLLNTRGGIDTPGCKQLLEEAKPLPVTFHRAFDHISEPSSALECLIQLGFSRVLTSGQASSAQEGVALIKNLVEQADGKITIMAGAGVTPLNVSEIVEFTGVKEVHASAKIAVKSAMERDSQIEMGNGDDMLTYVTDRTVVAEIVEAVGRAS
ncbi:unnamed protein product [Allacma fusca]|uniref:Copper homeostasis protein cutC homolog n=1 Tax=Allacma fusca TaxID=39272 RepID=A0A8J2K1N1_9HEXA|nr:unnamed protein product [Allacma fusca]